MNKSIQIGNKLISNEHPAYIIAEMSANHLQDYERAKSIILAAKESGADAIKLQSYRPDTITIDCNGEEFMASKGSPWEGQNLYQLYEKAYMPWDWHEALFKYAKELDITIFSSPFDFSAVDLLENLDTPAYKIASLEILDIPLIRRVAQTKKPVIISTGIAKLADIQRAIDVCKEEKNDKVILLKCVSEYPTRYEDMNLKTIPNMAETFDCIVGLSDHSIGYAVDVAAVALGCKVIEKHLTLRRADGGADSDFSTEPEEFKNLITNIRSVEQAIGHCTYELTEKQKNTRNKGRSLYIIKDIKKGEKFTEENVQSIRPGYGISTWHLKNVLGKKARQNLLRGMALKWEYLE